MRFSAKTQSEKIGFGSLSIIALIIIVMTLSLFGIIIYNGAPVISWEFWTQSPREGMTEGGIWPAIFGTIFLTFITTIFSTPIGVGTAIFLSQYARDTWAVRMVRLSIRNLAGVPSIVYGLFGVAIFVRGFGLGLSVLASGFTLGLLTLPWIISASEEALNTVPKIWRDGALGLGATDWEAIRSIVLPAAAPGIITGIILGLARAAGETAPILFTGVAFSLPNLPGSPMDQFMALPYHLYVLATQHHDLNAVRPIAYATGLTLLLIVATVTGAAAIYRSKLRKSLAGE